MRAEYLGHESNVAWFPDNTAKKRHARRDYEIGQCELTLGLTRSHPRRSHPRIVTAFWEVLWIESIVILKVIEAA